MSDSAWIFNSVDRQIPTGFTFNNFTPVTWDSVRYATDGMYDPAHPERLTCVNDGVHVILAQASWHNSSSGDYGIAIRKNGGAFVAEVQPGANGQFWPALECVSIHRCVAGDYFSVLVGQQTWATRTLGSDGSWFTIARIGEDTGATASGFTESQIRQMIREEIAATTLAPSAV